MMGPAFLLLATSVSIDARGCRLAEGYIYDQVGTGTAQVFNIREGILSEQSQRSASVRRITEFGGGFRICSNRSFHCIASSGMTAYNMIVPTSEANGDWSFQGIN